MKVENQPVPIIPEPTVESIEAKSIEAKSVSSVLRYSREFLLSLREVQFCFEIFTYTIQKCTEPIQVLTPEVLPGYKEPNRTYISSHGESATNGFVR